MINFNSISQTNFTWTATPIHMGDCKTGQMDSYEYWSGFVEQRM